MILCLITRELLNRAWTDQTFIEDKLRPHTGGVRAHKGPVIIYQLGVGLGNFSRGGGDEKILPQMGEWVGGKISFLIPWGWWGEHKYNFHFLFSGIKMLWLLGWDGGGVGANPQSPLSFIHVLILDAPFPPPTAEKKNMHMLMWKHSQILLRQFVYSVAINTWAHTNALRVIQIETSIMIMGSTLTRYWYFIEQNEREWNQFWGWAFQQACVTRDKWT